MTADGKIAFANREFTPFSSRRDRGHMMELRATSDAVMCGARTIEMTETILGNGGEKFRKLRLKRGLAEFPLRVIVSGSGSINPAANIFRMRFSPIVILTTARIPNTNLKKLRAVADAGNPKAQHCTAIRFKRLLWIIASVNQLAAHG